MRRLWEESSIDSGHPVPKAPKAATGTGNMNRYLLFLEPYDTGLGSLHRFSDGGNRCDEPNPPAGGPIRLIATGWHEDFRREETKLLKLKKYWPTGLGLPRLIALIIAAVAVVLSALIGASYLIWRLLGNG